MALNSRRPGGARKMPHFTAKNRPDQNERQLRDLHSFLHSEPPGVCCCTPTGMSTTMSMLQRPATVGLDCLLTACTRGICWTPAQTERGTPFQWTATGESQWSAELDQGKRPLRHDSVVNDLNMHNNGHVNNQSKVHSLALCVSRLGLAVSLHPVS